MAANGQLVFTDVDKVTFKGVGNASNAVIDTTTGKIGVGVDSPDANLHVLGNCFVSTNFELGGTMTMGTVTVRAQHELSAITATGNTTPHTIEFTNAETGIVTTGNVGIGTTSPDATLHVSGNAYVSSNLEVGTANLFVDTVNSRVGIGMTSPQYKLDVGNGGGDVMLRVMHQTASSGKLIFGRSGNTEIRSHAIESYNSSGSQNNYMKFLVHDGTGTSPYETRTEVMTLLGNGNVGIGTTSPDVKLHVEHYGSAIGDFEGIRIANHATNLHATSRPAYEFVVSDIDAGTGIGVSKFAIGYRDTTSASRTDRLVIDASGNVGIGTTDPGYTLDVNGATRVGEQLYVGPNNPNQTSPNTIYFGGLYGDNGYENCVIENRIWQTGTEKRELLLFSGNDTEGVSGSDRIRLRGNSILFDTYPTATTDRIAESVRMKITEDGNVDILSGDLNVVGSYKSDGKTVQRTLIGYQKFTSSTSVSYASGTTGYQNPWSVSYTRIHSGSEIYIIGDLCLAQAMGATATTSYRGIYGRLRVNSGGTDYYSDSTYDWQRIDNSFHEYQRQSRVHFDKQALSGTAAGQTMTIYAQVEEGGKSGTTNAFGLNIWAGRSFIEVFEVM
jgi:hypothetical protein